MDFSAYTAKLEPFLLMSKSAKGAGAAKLVQDATAANGVYVFAQLLEVPNIREVWSQYHMSFKYTESICFGLAASDITRAPVFVRFAGIVRSWDISGL